MKHAEENDWKLDSSVTLDLSVSLSRFIETNNLPATPPPPYPHHLFPSTSGVSISKGWFKYICSIYFDILNKHTELCFDLYNVFMGKYCKNLNY